MFAHFYFSVSKIILAFENETLREKPTNLLDYEEYKSGNTSLIPIKTKFLNANSKKVYFLIINLPNMLKLFIYLFIYLFICCFVCLFVYVSIYLYIYLFIYLFIYLSIYLSRCKSFYLLVSPEPLQFPSVPSFVCFFFLAWPKLA